MQQRRFPARNPFGDKIIHTYVWSEGDNLTVPTGSPDPFSFVTMRMDLGIGNVYAGGVPDKMGSSPGLTEYISLFDKYRVYSFICVTTFTNLTANPVLLWHQAAPGDLNGMTQGAVPLVSNIPEQRWTKSRLLGPAGSNRSVTKIVSRYNPYKVVSFDRGSTTGQAFGSVEDSGAPIITAITYALNAANGYPWFRYGITCYDDQVPGTSAVVPNVAYHTKVYLRVQHFDRQFITQ